MNGTPRLAVMTARGVALFRLNRLENDHAKEVFAVTLITFQVCMFPFELEAVIFPVLMREGGRCPSIDGVALVTTASSELLAMGSKSAPGRIVTSCAGAGVISFDFVVPSFGVGVTISAVSVAVFPFKAIPGPAVIERGYFLPICHRMTFLAIRTELPFVRIGLCVTAGAGIVFGDFEQCPIFCISRVTFVAGDPAMFPLDFVFRLGVMVEPDILPYKRALINMALVALVAKSVGMDITMAGTTGLSKAKKRLGAFGGFLVVTLLTLDAFMLVAQVVTGEIVAEQITSSFFPDDHVVGATFMIMVAGGACFLNHRF
jgi:hypothetical protein